MGEKQIVVECNGHYGDDLAIVNAARRSFGKKSEWGWITTETGTKEVGLKDKDKRLLEFLARGMSAEDFDSFLESVSEAGAWNSGYLSREGDNKEEVVELLWLWRNTPTHASPFGHCFFSFDIKVPVWLARQLVKHEYLRWSEFSRRYMTDDVEFYLNDYRDAPVDKKQGSGGIHRDNNYWQEEAKKYNQKQLDLYKSMIQGGVAPEQARGVLPTDLMTAATWSGSLDAFANMCKLRLGGDAQAEAQFVAKEIYKHLENHCPVSARSLVYGC